MKQPDRDLILESEVAESEAELRGMVESHHRSRGHAMPRLDERRQRRRYIVSAPVRVRPAGGSAHVEADISMTLDVAPGGILFATKLTSYSIGMEVAVIFPYNGNPKVSHAERFGRVARVSELEDGRRGVAISFAALQELESTTGAAASASDCAAGLCRHQAHRSKHGPLVLAVESDPGLRAGMKNLLTAEGYNVHAVATGDDARAFLEDKTPALVIAEAEGAGQAGYDLCAFVKSSQRLRHIPVVVITGSAFPSDYSIAHAMGATICMAKPYKNDRLTHVARLLAPPLSAKHVSQRPQPPHTLRRNAPAPKISGSGVHKLLKLS